MVCINTFTTAKPFKIVSTCSCSIVFLHFHDFHTFCFHFITAPSSPPLNVTAVAVSATTILVSWETPPIIHHNSPLTGYVIIYSDLSSPGGGDEMRSSIMDPTVLTALIVNLEPYSLYDVQVAAVNNAGAGPRSLEVTIETPRSKSVL